MKIIDKLIFWFRLKFFYFCISNFNFFYKKKIKYNYDFKKLIKILNDKKILLLGNAPINQNNINFDQFDIIIRINILPKQTKVNSHSRTDILMMLGSGGTHWVLEKNIIKIWLEYSNSFYTNYARGEIYHYPKNWEESLTKKLHAVPSAGVRCIDFLTKILSNPKISIYGFTFSEDNWYDKLVGQVKSSIKHNYTEEKKYFYEIIKKNENINIFFVK